GSATVALRTCRERPSLIHPRRTSAAALLPRDGCAHPRAALRVRRRAVIHALHDLEHAPIMSKARAAREQ
ncbi:MAG TPA: hypothetical protein PK490_18270, partial [Prosthecobacter sp.]|nr:hypothetical protein [Prosthecobacter sp.]